MVLRWMIFATVWICKRSDRSSSGGSDVQVWIDDTCSHCRGNESLAWRPRQGNIKGDRFGICLLRIRGANLHHMALAFTSYKDTLYVIFSIQYNTYTYYIIYIYMFWKLGITILEVGSWLLEILAVFLRRQKWSKMIIVSFKMFLVLLLGHEVSQQPRRLHRLAAHLKRQTAQ